MNIQEKIDDLKIYLSGYDRLAVAFSGGVDSTFLLLAAHEVLGENLMAVTVTGPNFAPDEVEEAKKLCRKHDISHLIYSMPKEVFDSISNNPANRCYICKKGLFSSMMDAIEGIPLADGTNLDDADDYRPGRQALKELHVISPLEETGFTKAEVRDALKAMNVKVWNKPAYACLATRIPVGEKLTKEKLTAVYEAEAFIRDLGFKQVRVRHHGKIAIVEVPPEDRELFARPVTLDAVNKKIKELGFEYATMDLGGYVMGHLNRK